MAPMKKIAKRNKRLPVNRMNFHAKTITNAFLSLGSVITKMTALTIAMKIRARIKIAIHGCSNAVMDVAFIQLGDAV